MLNAHKYFILYFRDEENEMVGSDSYCPVDGRFNLISYTDLIALANQLPPLNNDTLLIPLTYETQL